MLVDEDGRLIERGRSCFDFVNYSLEQFSRSIEVLIKLFPYDGGDDGYAMEDWQRVADKLIEQLRTIDPHAFSDENGEGFWPEFYWDVANGDFATFMFREERPV